MDKIDVLYTVNESFLDIMLASILSLIENCNVSNINLHIIAEKFSDESYVRINKIIEEYPRVKVEFYPFEDFNIEKFKMPRWRDTQIANARLFFQEYLKDKLSNIDNLLYLDSDTIVASDLNDLSNYRDVTVAAVKDLIKIRDLKVYNLPVYYNSGVLFINVDDWIEKSYYDRLIENIEQKREILRLPDQDLLNLTFYDEISALPPEYNFRPVETIYGKLANKMYFDVQNRQVSAEEITDARKKIKILHACDFSDIKPWTNNIVNPYNAEFMKYILKANPNYEKNEINGVLKLFAFNNNLMKSTVFVKSFLPSKIQKKYIKLKSKNKK